MNELKSRKLKELIEDYGELMCSYGCASCDSSYEKQLKNDIDIIKCEIEKMIDE